MTPLLIVILIVILIVLAAMLVRSSWFVVRGPSSVEFTNESTELLVSFDNEMKLGADGWGMIAPFGDFPGMAVEPQPDGTCKKFKAIQRVDHNAATQMVAEYKANTRGVTGYFKKRPIFHGHPDGIGGIGAKYPDKAPKGVFANVAARADGFYGEPMFTEEGEKLVASGTARGFSGRWESEFVGVENGVRVYRPCKFLSAGLTNQPNLPVQLLNEAETPGDDQNQNTKQMRKSIIALLTKLGVQFANDATDEQLVALEGSAITAIDGLKADATKVVELSNEKETISAEVTKRDGTITALTTERDTLRTNFTNERQARIAREIGLGLSTGRITAAEKADWERRLGNEAQFANELSALEKLAPKVKTGSVTITRGDRKVELTNANERGVALKEIVVEIANERKLDPVKNYNAIIRIAQERHPQLFEAMAGPKINGRG